MPTASRPSTELTATPQPTKPVSLDGYSRSDVHRSVREGEAAAIDDMTEAGTLSANGPITDADVQALVFMAVSTQEILDQIG